mgnify:CR=1 FL=1
MNETMKPSCGEAYDATPVAVLAASETLTIALGMLTKSPVAAIVAGGLTGCVCSLALPSISGNILARKREVESQISQLRGYLNKLEQKIDHYRQALNAAHPA